MLIPFTWIYVRHLIPCPTVSYLIISGYLVSPALCGHGSNDILLIEFSRCLSTTPYQTVYYQLHQESPRRVIWDPYYFWFTWTVSLPLYTLVKYWSLLMTRNVLCVFHLMKIIWGSSRTLNLFFTKSLYLSSNCQLHQMCTCSIQINLSN